MKYDVAIIGTGPAGISAALNLKLYNKEIVWFGSKDFSVKVAKSEKIANYPGVAMVTGEQLNHLFREQIEQAGLTITDKMVTNIMTTKSGFMLLADNEMYEAKKLLLATGTVLAKSISGEDELLGKGVSYCATCDGFLYKEKTIAVICASKRYEHEVEYLADTANTVYLFASYPDCEIKRDNVKILPSPIKEITGVDQVERIVLKDGSSIEVDGVFILRNAVAPTALLKKLRMNGNHIAVDSHMETNIPGCYAAGDCTGRPYQIAKAVGEGNIAAHAMLE